MGSHAHGSWTAANDAGEVNPADNTARFTIAVPGATGVVHVKVYIDIKGDYDDTQPGLPNATVVIRDQDKTTTVGTAETGAGGYVTTTLPAGTYWLTAPGWRSRATSLRVTSR